jgi:putative DNA primase/helicase
MPRRANAGFRNCLLARPPDITARSLALGITNEGTVMSVIKILKQSANTKPTVDQVVAIASALHKGSTEEEIAFALKSAAKAAADPVGRAMMLSKVEVRTGLPRKALSQQLALFEQELGLKSSDEALSLARLVLAKHFKDGTHILRCADGTYWRWIGTHWRETTRSELRKRILAEANCLNVIGISLSQLVSQAKALIDDLLGTDDDVMGFNDDPSPAVNCLNGEVWIDEKGNAELRPHRPESRFTYYVPITFDPKSSCPAYDQALLQIFSKAQDPDDMVRHWHEFVGCAIQPRRDIASFWLLIGHGSNGKSKLIETIQNLVGSDAVLNDQIASFQRDRFNIPALAGKLLFIDDDMASDTRLDDGLLKKISEAKEMSARHAYGERKFKFRCLALPIMVGNSYPTTTDTSHGLRRRAMVIPFDKRFEGDADQHLFPKIWSTEMSGILNRTLQGLKRLRQRGGFNFRSTARRRSRISWCMPTRSSLSSRKNAKERQTHECICVIFVRR